MPTPAAPGRCDDHAVTIGWLDLSAGASGDMLLGALVDAGVPLEVPAAAVAALPVERIRLGTEVVTEQQTVGGEVRKERVEVEQPEDLSGRGEDRDRIG